MRYASNQKGIVMPTVLVVMVVITLLGFALWQYSITDTKQVVREEQQMQAFYIARSGADSFSKYIIENPDNLTFEEQKSFIEDAVAAGKSKPTPLGNGTFTIEVSGDLFTTLNIKSEGVVDDVKRTVTLSLIAIGIPPVPENAKSANVIGWLNGNSHVIEKGKDSPEYETSPVSFDPGNGKQTMKTTPNGNPDFTAPSIFFEDNVFIDKKSTLTLRSELIVCRGTIELVQQKNGKDPAQLKLYVRNGEGIDGADIGGIPGKKYRKIYFLEGVSYVRGSGKSASSEVIISPGAYYYPDDYTLPRDEGLVPANGGLIPTSMTEGYKEVWK